jgi:preprotein translocase subunit SecY
MGMLGALLSAFKIPDLRRKLLFTAALLVVFRFVSHVPVPGVNVGTLRSVFETNQLVGMLDLFSGGAMASFSIAAMGVYPYITSSIIMQLLVPIVPRLTELSKEGESGRNQINQYTHWLTVPLAALQAYGTPQLLNASLPVGSDMPPVLDKFGFDRYPVETLAIVCTMTAGTMLLIWLGELITQYGVGNGTSMIIFGGIVARMPALVSQTVVSGTDLVKILVFVALGVLTCASIVWVYEGQRKIPVEVAKRIRGNRVYGGGRTNIPLKVNSAGMIPLIFAQSIMIFPGTISGYFIASDNEIVRNVARVIHDTFNLQHSWFYWTLYFVLVVSFTFFYAVVLFQQQNIAENLQKQGGFVPGIRPGPATQRYLYNVLMRITLIGAVFLGIVAILPFIAQTLTGTQALTLSATALLIVVGVGLDTMRQLEAQLIMRNYRGFIR